MVVSERFRIGLGTVGCVTCVNLEGTGGVNELDFDPPLVTDGVLSLVPDPALGIFMEICGCNGFLAAEVAEGEITFSLAMFLLEDVGNGLTDCVFEMGSFLAGIGVVATARAFSLLLFVFDC